MNKSLLTTERRHLAFKDNNKNHNSKEQTNGKYRT